MFSVARSFLTDLWVITAPYWRSPERRISGILLAAIIGLNLGIVYINVLLNWWYALFYNALQNRDFSAFLHQLGRFAIIAALFIFAAVYRLYLRQMLQIRWRRWLTERYVGKWLGNHAHYRLQLDSGRTDNPDQRISEDINVFVGQFLVLSLGLIEAIVTLASFAAILWGLSGALSIGSLVIPGYMLWAAIIYSAAGSLITFRIGRPLVGLNYNQQKFEADLRFSLVRVRENSEGIALYGGEREEAKGLSGRLGPVVGNWWQIMRRQKRLAWFVSGYDQIAVIFPFLVAAPRYFAGAIQLGGLMQTAQAFGQVQTSLSWFVTAYADLAAWKATVDRLVGFERTLGDIGSPRETGLFRYEGPRNSSISLRNFDLWVPNGGRPLLQGVNLDLPPRCRLLISGPSGSGKSTLLRAISGIWPYCRGFVSVPEGARLLFLPQEPYLPIGRLRDVATYPGDPASYSDEQIRAALTESGLGKLACRLDERRVWAQQLSPGEQQRLAVARAMLLEPEWLFLDEATSALDETGEADLYRHLIERLEKSAIVSVAHRSSLLAFHIEHLVFSRLPGAESYHVERAQIRETAPPVAWQEFTLHA